MKRLFPSAHLLFFSRVSLYFLSGVILLFSLSGLIVHISVISDVVFESIDIHLKLHPARSELVRLVISCMMFGILLLIRAPLNRKDLAFNTTCHWYGATFLYSSLIVACLFFLISADPLLFPNFGVDLRSRVYFWPFVNLFYIATSISFVYRSLQD